MASGETDSGHDDLPAATAASEVEASLTRIERATAELRATSVEQLRLLQAACEIGTCRKPPWNRAQELRAVIVEAVGVLEATRTSFKSRQLEALRRRLMEVLRTS
jgi:hypothetical protein